MSGGKKFDEKKPPMGLIPAEAEIYEALVWGQGAKKYGVHNFREGITFLRIIGGIQRHLAAIKLGQDIDHETGLPNAAAIRCGAAMLIAFMDRVDLDDRYKGYTSEQIEQYLTAMGYETIPQIMKDVDWETTNQEGG
jgi:hypothetical protein